MLDTLAFATMALVAILASIAIFIEEKLLRAAAFLTIVFFVSSLIFILLNQVFIALVQLLVFVGGLSTYLIVAVATEKKGARLNNLRLFATLSTIVSLGFLSIVGYLPAAQAAGPSLFSASAIAAFSSDYAYFYIIAVLLFTATMGSVLVIKKFKKLIT